MNTFVRQLVFAVLFSVVSTCKVSAQYGPFYNQERNLSSFTLYNEYLSIIKSYNTDKNIQVSLEKLDSLSNIAFQQADYRQFLFLKNEVSNFYKFKSQFNEGYADLEKAMKVFSSLADTINLEYAVSQRLLRGLLFRSGFTTRGEEELLASQLAILKKLNITGEPMTNLLVDYGMFYNRQGNDDKAVETLYEARTVGLKNNDFQSVAVADYSLIGKLNSLDLESTILDVLKNDLDLLKKSAHSIPKLSYMSYFNYAIGNRYFRDFNNATNAVSYILSAIECMDTLKYPIWNLKASSHSLVAICYSTMNDTANFWKHYNLASSIVERPMSDYNRGLTLISLVEAALPIAIDSSQMVLDRLKERKESAAHFQENIVKYQALIFIEKGLLSEAIDLITNHMALCDDINGTKVPAISDSIELRDQLEYFDILNKAYRNSPESFSNRMVRKDIIAKQNTVCVKLIEKHVFGFEVSSIFNDYSQFINASIRFLLENFDSATDAELVSHLFFSSKALQLNNHLGKNHLQSQIESDTALFKQLLRNTTNVQKLKNELSNTQNSEEKTLELERDLNQALIESLITRYKLNRRLDIPYNFITIPTLSQVQEKLEKDQGILEFCTDDTTLQWQLITRNEIYVGKKAFDNLRKYITDELYKTKTGQAETRLGSQLFNPDLENKLLALNKLTIIPDKDLSAISFENLELPSSGRKLVETHILSYSYSTSLWYRTTTRSLENSKNLSLLAVAPVNFTVKKPSTPEMHFAATYRGEASLDPLVSSKEEVEKIGQLFKTNKVEALSLLGTNATVENVISQMANFNTLHFATHGVVNRSNPERSGLFLYPDTTLGSDNNFLSLGRLHTLKINSDLVVLSACNSGTGTVAEGEGIVALPRGFLLAGVPNVIASLWKVNDERTKEFMILFYQHLLSGKAYADALRQTKLDCIKKGFIPLDWAGFVLIGNQ